MKQNFILFITLFACLAACKNDVTHGELKGEIKGLGNDTIYLYSDDEWADFIESIPVADDKFAISLKMDTTLIQTRLFIGDDIQYPIYLERGKTIRIKGDATTLRRGQLEVKGNPENEALTAFNQTLPQPATPTDTLTLRLVEDYIRQNQKSLINLYLLDKYFVQVPAPDLHKIKELITIMDGSLQDKHYIDRISDWIKEAEKSEVNKTAPSFTITNIAGKRISRSDYRDRYLLINFWASWSDTCSAYNNELKAIYKTYPPKTEKERDRQKEKAKKDRTYKIPPELAIISISLNLDKSAWEDAVKQDTLKWEQLNDFSGWNSTVVKQYGITDIPYNVLTDTRGRIIARGITGKELELKLDSLLKQPK